MTGSLGGKSILIVEDEMIIGMMLSNEIAYAGGVPIGPVTSIAEALKAIESGTIDTVVLDAKLADGSAAAFAACLEERGIPFVVSSGYEETSLPKELRGAPFVAKPISIPLLMEAIGSLAARPLRRPPQAPQSTIPGGPNRPLRKIT
jgi:DNA-binding NtrC family response regulator